MPGMGGMPNMGDFRWYYIKYKNYFKIFYLLNFMKLNPHSILTQRVFRSMQAEKASKNFVVS